MGVLTGQGDNQVFDITNSDGYLTINPSTGCVVINVNISALDAGISSSIDHGDLSGLTGDDHTQYHTDARADTWLDGSLAIQSTVTPSGTTQTIDFSLGYSITVDLGSATGDVTLTLSNMIAGGSYVICFINGSTPRDVVWPAATIWPEGAAPILTQSNDALDRVSLFYDGTNIWADFSSNYS